MQSLTSVEYQVKRDENAYSGTICKDSTSGNGGKQRELEVARYCRIRRKIVKKMCQYSTPPGYRRKREFFSPKLAEFTDIMDAILEADK